MRYHVVEIRHELGMYSISGVIITGICRSIEMLKEPWRFPTRLTRAGVRPSLECTCSQLTYGELPVGNIVRCVEGKLSAVAWQSAAMPLVSRSLYHFPATSWCLEECLAVVVAEHGAEMDLWHVVNGLA